MIVFPSFSRLALRTNFNDSANSKNVFISAILYIFFAKVQKQTMLTSLKSKHRTF